MAASDLAAVTRRVLAEQSAAYDQAGTTLPEGVHDAVSDFRAAIDDQLGAADQLAQDTAELQGRRDLLPNAGYQRLRRDAHAEAQQTVLGADRRASDALDRLRLALTDASQPEVKPGRESLARQELALAIGDASGQEAASRALQVAEHGSREAAAVLGSSFGGTLLQSRGLTGQSFTDTISGVRAVVAKVAAKSGGTPRELLAGKLLGAVDGLGAARGASGAYFAQVADHTSR